MERCDHCDSNVDCENDQFYSIYSMQDFILWCEHCVKENEALLEELGVPFERNTYGIWSSSNNITILKRLTKERNEAINQGKSFTDPTTEKSFPAASCISEPRCRLEYYGLDCECYDCNRRNKTKNINRNVFGYTSEELYGHYG